MEGRGFVSKVREAYSDWENVSLQRMVLEATIVPQDWAQAIKKVYGYRWDEHPGAKKRGWILQRVYLACKASEWKLRVCPLWGERDAESERWRSEEIRQTLGEIWVNVFVGNSDTATQERKWANLVCEDWVIPRVRVLMHLPIEECPCCGKKENFSCDECGFPEIDPTDYIGKYVKSLQEIRSQGKFLATDFVGYVNTDGQFKDSWCYAVSNGECWWEEIFNTEEGNLFERYGKRNYFIFRSNTLNHKGECLQRIRREVKIIWAGWNNL